MKAIYTVKCADTQTTDVSIEGAQGWVRSVTFLPTKSVINLTPSQAIQLGQLLILAAWNQLGIVEEDFATAEGESVNTFLRQNIRDEKHFFGDRLIGELREMLEKRKTELHSLYEQYATSPDHPARYSTFYFSVLHDASNVVVIFHFTHINRHHAMSPDGWASFNRTYLHHCTLEEILESK
jgi:hypothetical protein